MTILKAIKDNEDNYYRIENVQLFPTDGKVLMYKDKCNVELKKFESLSDFKAGSSGSPVYISYDLSDNANEFINTFLDDLLDNIEENNIDGTIEDIEV